jgi:hypothetical protein
VAPSSSGKSTGIFLKVKIQPITREQGTATPKEAYMDSTYFTTLISHKNVNCLRIYGFLLRTLSSSL